MNTKYSKTNSHRCQRRVYLDELREVGKLEQVSKSKIRIFFLEIYQKDGKKRSNKKEMTATPAKLFDSDKSYFMD